MGISTRKWYTTAKSRRFLGALLTTLFMLHTSPTEAQDLDWIHRMSASVFSFGNAAQVDPAGNYFITGFFGGSMDFGGKMLEGAGLGDLFIAKYNTSRKLLWVKVGTSEGWNGGRDIGVAPDGSVLVVGRIEGTTQFDGVSAPANGQNDAVIVKYSAEGNALWAKSGGGAGMDWGNSVAVDAEGNSYMVGYFNGSASFGGTTLNSAGQTEIFVTAYDTDGRLLWARSAGGSGIDEAYGVAVDSQGNVYVTGIITGSAKFGSTTITGTATGSGFLARYGSDGTLAWVKEIPGNSKAESVSINQQDEIFVAGSYTGTINPSPISLKSAGSADLFVLKYTTSGAPSNGWSYGGTGEDGVAAFGKSLEVIAASDGGFYLGSSFSNTLDVGATTLDSRGGSDIFVARFAADGSGIWGISGGGSERDHYVSISVDSAQNAYLLGNYFSPTFVMKGITMPRHASTDMVMAKIDGRSASGQPVAEFSRTEMNIGNVVTGTSRSGGLTIKAGSDVPLEITNVYLEGDDPSDTVFSLISPDPNLLPASLTGSSSMSVTVQFTPTEPGDAETRLVIETNDAMIPSIKIPVTGVGLDGSMIPRAVLSVEDIDLGEIAVRTKTRTSFTIAPGTAAGLKVEDIEFEDPKSGSDGFTIVEPTTFPNNIAAGESLEVVIDFRPQNEGEFEARIVITTNDKDKPYRNVDLMAVVTEAPLALVSASDLIFGTVDIGETGRDSLIIASGSDGLLMIESITLALGEGSGGFRLVRPEPTTTYPLEVQDGRPAVIAVEFAPLEDGPMTGTLTIRTNDPDTREVTISLSGEGESTLSVGDRSGASILEVMEIHPSPIRSSGELVLKLRVPAELQVELIDLSGRIIADLYNGRSGGSERIEIPADRLHSGLYFCRVTVDGRENLVPVTIVR